MRGELVVERELAHAPERVWAYVTSARGGRALFSAPDFEARVGARFEARVPRGPGFDGRVQVEVMEVQAPRRLRLYWSGGPVSGQVQLTLEPHGQGGCRLLLAQTGFDQERQHGLASAFLALWNHRLQALAPLGSGGAAGAAAGVGGASVAAGALAGIAGLVALILAFLGAWSWLDARVPSPVSAADGADEPSTRASLGAGAQAALGQQDQASPQADDGADAARRIPRVVREPREPGELAFYEQLLPTTLDPLYARTMVDRRAQELVFDRLFYRSAITNELRSRVVARYQALDGGQRLRIVLRDGIRWHDGEPLTARDLCFTVRALQEPSNPTSLRRAFREGPVDCQITETLEAVLVFGRPQPYPREHAALPLLPAHVFDDDPRVPVDHDFSRRPVGTGPFRALAGRRSVHFEAVSNRHHEPGLSALRLDEGGDPFVQVRTVLNGGIDGLVQVHPALRAEITASDDVALESYDLRSWWFLSLDTRGGPLASRHVRTAVEAAIDRQELLELTVGVDPGDPSPPAEFISGPFVVSSPYYNRQIKVEARDRPQQVEAAMARASARKVRGRWQIDGQPVTLRLAMRSVLDSQAKDLATQVSNQLRVAGFEVDNLVKISEEDWNRRVLAGHDLGLDIIIGEWSSGMVEDLDPIFHTRSGGRGDRTLMGYSSARTDQILDQFAQATTDAQARDAMHRLHAWLDQDKPYVFLWKLDARSAWRERVTGNTIAPYYYFTEVDGWDAR